MTCDVFFLSAEASGDDLAVSVIRKMRELQDDISIGAIGGKRLSRVGIESPVDVSPLGIVGLFEGLKVYQKVIRLAEDATQVILNSGARTVVLVDSWGFSIRVAERLKKADPDLSLVKLVGPQVWATRSGRAKTLCKYFDHLLCIHEFELPFYEPFGLDCTVIGNPALDRVENGDGEKFRKRYGISASQLCLLILPGSRNSELSRVAPVLAKAARELQKERGDQLISVVLVSDAMSARIHSGEIDWPQGALFIEDENEKADVMAGSDVALACSGTVTTELATQGCPMIVGYQLGWLTWVIARLFLFKSRYITLFNIAAGNEIAPEFVQTKFSTDRIKRAADRLLDGKKERQKQTSEQYEALKKMGLGGRPAHEIAADKILSLTEKKGAE